MKAERFEQTTAIPGQPGYDVVPSWDAELRMKTLAAIDEMNRLLADVGTLLEKLVYPLLTVDEQGNVTKVRDEP